MERQHTTNLWKPLKMLPSHITEVTIRSTLYHCLRQLDPPLMPQRLLSEQANEYSNFAACFIRTYLASVVISTLLHHCWPLASFYNWLPSYKCISCLSYSKGCKTHHILSCTHRLLRDEVSVRHT